MSNDPLMAMRMEEQKALQRIMNNPIKLRQIRGAVEERQAALMGSSGERHKHKKEKHKHKKEKHKHKKEKSSSSHKHKKRKSRHSDSDSASDSEDSAAGGGGGCGGEVATTTAALKKPGFGLQMYSSGTRLTGDSEAATSAGEGKGGGASSSRDFEPSASFAGARPGWVFTNGAQGPGYYRDAKAAAPAAPAPASGQAIGPSRPAAAASSRGPSAGSSSSSRPAPSQHQRRGPLSAAEKEERLRQMMSDADAHDGDRKKRAKIDETRLAEEQAALSAAASAASADGADERGPSFVRDMARKVTGESSVAEQINQQKHYLQRGRGAGAETFTRR